MACISNFGGLMDNSLEFATSKIVNDRIDEFHFYLNQLGYEKARSIMMSSTCLKPVIDYVKKYQENQNG